MGRGRVVSGFLLVVIEEARLVVKKVEGVEVSWLTWGDIG